MPEEEEIKERECLFCGEPTDKAYCNRGCETADSQERV